MARQFHRRLACLCDCFDGGFVGVDVDADHCLVVVVLLLLLLLLL